MDQGKQAVPNGVIVHGPQGCGETRHAAALAAHFGVGRVIDGWMPGDPVEPDALHLSQVDVPGSVAYESLKEVVGCEECGGRGEIRRPYTAVERMPCPVCASSQS